jgi:serine/threonine protein kinase
MDNGPREPHTPTRSPYAETVAATPVRSAAETPQGQLPEITAEPAPGEKRYVVGKPLVIVCHDEIVGRDVALKRMRSGLASRADLQARFLREARVQGRIEHPSIVPVYDLDVAARAPFLTMKRVHGATLGEILARLHAREKDAQEKYSRHKLLSAFVGVCLTVDLAHTNGVVHRDLKPDNVMLGPYGELYVLDWGIAKIVDDPGHVSSEETDASALRTRTGTFLGTPGYMAPEQLEAPSQVDARADVYALGAILFEILALEPLHTIADVERMALATRDGVEARPSIRVPGCDTTPELDAVCRKATARDRSDRFASVRELCEAVERFRERDRDLEQRRAEATVHAESAAAAARDAASELDPKTPRRVHALREASLALALDPAHMGALDVVRELLAHPPRVPPAEVDRELEAATAALYRGVTRGGTLLNLTWFAYLPLAIAVGLRNVGMYAMVSALFACAALWSYWDSRNPPSRGRPRLLPMILVGAPLSSLATIWSPLVLVPPLAIIFAAGMIIVGRSSSWPVREAVAACAIVVIPVVLSLVGLIPPFVAFDGGRILLLPAMVALPLTLTVIVSTVTLALIVASIFWWAVLLRTALSKAERTIQLYAWHLRQLLTREPGHGRAVSTRPPAPDAPADLLVTVVDTGAGRVGLDDPLTRLDKASRYEPLGEGCSPGDGVVLLFEDRRIGRRVAMKVADARASEESKRRLRDEAHLRARLEHPSIPPLYDTGTDEEGGVYFTMRPPRGVTLADAMALRQYSLYRLIEAFATACQAVEFAHASGIAHRSLGPDCVVIGEYGEVYVTGWGSATNLELSTDEHALVRADVAALVVILASILAAAEATLAGAGTPGALVPAGGYLPPELDAMVTRPGGFASAAELHSGIGRFLEGERDVSRRRARAAEYLASAEEALARALAAESGGADDRAAAMRARGERAHGPLDGTAARVATRGRARNGRRRSYRTAAFAAHRERPLPVVVRLRGVRTRRARLIGSPRRRAQPRVRVRRGGLLVDRPHATRNRGGPYHHRGSLDARSGSDWCPRRAPRAGADSGGRKRDWLRAPGGIRAARPHPRICLSGHRGACRTSDARRAPSVVRVSRRRSCDPSSSRSSAAGVAGRPHVGPRHGRLVGVHFLPPFPRRPKWGRSEDPCPCLAASPARAHRDSHVGTIAPLRSVTRRRSRSLRRRSILCTRS